MTTTHTSGAAIQRYKIGYHPYEWAQRSRTPSGIPDASGSWVRYADHVTALAAGQATAAPAEPDPTPGDHPQPCDSELFESGVSVGLFDIPQWTAEALCKGIAAATGARVDWHYIGGRVHVKALPAPTSAEGVAYAALPDEREMLKHALWLASSFTVHRYLMSNAEGRWSGAEKATCHDELCCLYVAVFRGVEVDQVRVGLEADWVAVHDATQELTDHMDVVIGFPLKGVPDYEALAPKFFAHFHRLATRALRASHGQASSQAGEYPALVCDYCGALTPDPWHSSGMLHGKMSKHIHSCDACAPHGQAPAGAAQADSVPAVSDLPPLPAPDLRDVGTKPQEIKEFLKGYATEYARTAIAARDPADSVQEDAALWHWLAEYLVGTRTDLDDEIVASENVNDLRKLVKAARKQGANHDNA